MVYLSVVGYVMSEWAVQTLEAAGEPFTVCCYCRTASRADQEKFPQYHNDWHIAIYLPVPVFPFVIVSPEVGSEFYARLFVLRCDVTDAP